MKLTELKSLYGQKKVGSFTNDERRAFRARLLEVEPPQLVASSDYELYIELVKLFREDEADSRTEEFRNFLRNTLSQGDDGMYAGEDRFLFELIQNVDDCEYADDKACDLDVYFDANESTITLTYNEAGFLPRDVFNITGIAEPSKNLTAGKVQIGEKGIGFKSVFGIAEEVLIQSGNFSFALTKDDFTIPLPRYDAFTAVNGTILKLFLKKSVKVEESSVDKIYYALAEKYKSEKSIINKNPILFLNKLTKLRMHKGDSFDSVCFTVTRGDITTIADNVTYENGIEIGAKYACRRTSEPYEKSVRCYKFTSELTYDRAACVSRYGEKTQFQSKTMRLRVLFPQVSELSKIKTGSLYSFLPTQITTTVPIIAHAPFKLSASRDYVDSQGGNKWFKDTIGALSKLIVGSYLQLSKEVQESIARYIPHRSNYGSNEYIFDGNDKVSCLLVDELSRNRVIRERLFICADREYRKACDVCALHSDEDIQDKVLAHELAGFNMPLFSTSDVTGLKTLGVRIEIKVLDSIFCRALSDGAIAKRAFDYLKSIDYKPGDEVLRKLATLKYSIESLIVLSATSVYKDDVLRTITAYAKQSFVELPTLNVPKEVAKFSANSKFIAQALDDIDGETKLKNYWSRVQGRCCCVDELAEGFYFPTKDFILLSSKAPLKAFAAFARRIDDNPNFQIAVMSRSVSDELDKLEDDATIGGDEYFSKLKAQRQTLKRAFGERAYERFIQLINKSGKNKNRFINELLQNADDCHYPKGETPTFKIAISSEEIIAESNEVGFTRKNLRAITSIGESTKKRIFSNDEAIGEKGIGFKSVFALASKVVIHTKSETDTFNFSLSETEPTIPTKITGGKKLATKTGTRMEFTLREALSSDVLTEEFIINICRCLRKLKKIEIGKVVVEIKDSEDDGIRIITIKDGNHLSKTLRMRVVKHSFIIDDAVAIAERMDDDSIKIGAEQSVFVYIPDKEKAEKGDRQAKKYPLYVGLPTKHTLRIPLYIDAPFALTTSREETEETSLWNEIVTEQVYHAVAKALEHIKDEDRIGVLDYIPANGELFNEEAQHHNTVDFSKLLSGYKILPTLNKDIFVAPNSQGLVYYPSFIKPLREKTSMDEIKKESTIDFYKTVASGIDKYLAVLSYLGVEQADDYSVLGIMQDYASGEVLLQKSLRDSVYSYLKNIERTDKQLFPKMRLLEIIPVKRKGDVVGIEWISYATEIYYGENEKSTDSYYILETNLMPMADFDVIFGTRISEMNSHQRAGMYRDKLSRIFGYGQDNLTKYEWLINEIMHNKQELTLSREWFLANKYQVKLKTMSGEITSANRVFTASDNVYNSIQGSTIKKLLIASNDRHLADFLQCLDITKVGFDDIDTAIEIGGELSEGDILDLQNILIIPYWDGIAILAQCKEKGYISADLIEKMGLGGLGGRPDIDDEDYEFPSRPVVNMERLTAFIQREWQTNPIEIVEEAREITVHVGRTTDGNNVPIIGDASNQYAKNMYTVGEEREVCFCQMCQMPHPSGYIEVNKVEYLPKFFWEQLKLTFCLNCSKNFECLRNNNVYGQPFIDAIINGEFEEEEDGRILVRIGDKRIAFTATHFAEAQAILKIMNESEDDE